MKRNRALARSRNAKRIFFIAQRVFLLATVTFLTVGFLASCSGGFVSFYLKEAKGDTRGDATPSQDGGYLKVHIYTELSNLKLAAPNDRFSFLSLSIENSSGIEFPVFLYDFKKGEQSSVDHFDIGRAAYINMLSGKERDLTIHARVIPDSYAAAYAKTVGDFKTVLSQVPLGEISTEHPSIAIPAGILSALSDIIEREGNRQWTTKKRIGLTDDAGPDSLRDGSPVIVFLVPEKESRKGEILTQIASSRFQLCGDLQYRICKEGETTPFSEIPYFLLRISLTDYRPLTDIAPPVDCERNETDLGLIETALRQSSLIPKQRHYERILVDRLRILTELRNLENPGIDEIAEHMNRLRNLRPGAEDPYWQAHYAENYKTLGSCIESEIISRGLKERLWMSVLDRAFDESLHWERRFREAEKAGKTREERVAILEKALASILTPIDKLSLSSGTVFEYFIIEKNHIEKYLRKFDESLRSASRTDGAEDETLAREILSRLDSTSCETCRPILEAAYSDIRIRQAQGKLETAQSLLLEKEKETARLEIRLASLRIEARRLAALARRGRMQMALAENVERSLDESNDLIGPESRATPERLHQAIETVQNSMEPIQESLNRMEKGEEVAP